MSNAISFGIGTRLVFEGEVWSVVGFSGTHAIIGIGDRRWQLTVAELLERTTVFEPADDDPSCGSELPIDGIPPAALAKAYKVMGDMLEVETGYREPFETTPPSTKPRRAYDPTRTTLTERVEAMALERKIKSRVVWDRLKAWRDNPSVLTFVDKRALREYGYGASAERAEYMRKVRAAILDVLEGRVDKSTISIAEMSRLTQIALKEQDPSVKVPPYNTFRRLAREVGRELGYFGDAKTRRGNKSRPDGTYGSFVATRPGEVVLIDSTRLDVHAIDPDTGKWVPVELTVAMDLFTRAIVAFRLTHGFTRAVDAAWLLHDILSPRRLGPGGDPAAKWRFVGVPEKIVITNTALDVEEPLAHFPVVEPETVIIDRGRVFVSNNFIDACAALGTSVVFARPGRPTDKAPVERFFRTVRALLEAVPGYKGPNVYSRGKDVEAEAVHTIEELAEIILAWLVHVYHQRPHSGLHLWSAPHVPVSPTQMCDAGVAAAGFLRVPRDPHFALRLLPVHAVANIHHYGVERRGLIYDDDVLREFEKRRSPYGGRLAGRWPFRYNPDDLRCLWFRHPERGTWHQIGLKGRPASQPFGDTLLSYAKHLMLAEGVRRPSREDLAQTVTEILARVSAGRPVTIAEQREAAKGAHRAAQAAKDQAGAGLPPIDPDDPATVTAGWHPPVADEVALPSREPDDEVEGFSMVTYEDEFDLGAHVLVVGGVEDDEPEEEAS